MLTSRMLRNLVLVFAATALMLTLTLGAAPAGAPMGTGEAQAAQLSGKHPCAKLKKKMNKATGKRKKQLRRKYKACMKRVATAKLTASVKSQLINYRFVGARSDGMPVDYLFCSKRRALLNTDGAVYNSKKWLVYKPTGKKPNFKTQIRESSNPNAGGLQISVARRGKQYYVGNAEFGKVANLGKVTRTRDAEACKAL